LPRPGDGAAAAAAIVRGTTMSVMNIVHMRVRPGKDADYVDIHRAFEAKGLAGLRNFWLVKTGERDFCVVGEWQDRDSLAAARPAMVANLDRLRPILEDLGGGRGVTEPWSGEVALHLSP
jgi:hypothetical protein